MWYSKEISTNLPAGFLVMVSSLQSSIIREWCRNILAILPFWRISAVEYKIRAEYCDSWDVVYKLFQFDILLAVIVDIS